MTFPLVPPSLRTLAAVASLQELQSIDTTILEDGAVVAVPAITATYMLLKQSTAAPDGANIVAPLQSSGRWICTSVPPVISSQQTAWFVDPANSTGNASDGNVGDTASAPLRTMAQTARRLSRPNVTRVPSVVTVLSDAPADDPFFVDVAYAGELGLNGKLDVVGAATQVLEEVVLTGVTSQNTTTNTYHTITVAGFDWTPYINQRVRIVAGGSIDAVAWIADTDPVAGVDTAIVNRPSTSGGGITNFGVGQTVAIEQLTRLGRLGVVAATANFLQFPVNFIDVETTAETFSYTGVQLTAFYRSRVRMQWTGQTDLNFFQGSNVEMSSNRFLYGGGAEFNGCLLHGMQLFQGRWAVLTDSLHVGSMTVHPDSSLIASASLGFLAWSSAALEVRSGGVVDGVSGRLWGSETAANTYGIRARSGALVTYTTLPNIIGALSPGQDVLVGGTPLAYGALPNVNAANQAAIVVRA